ncbi:hypothetical protein OIU77_010814 [Salix suchowensis]|uniref:Uncharacterized protein n=1 Tax=Salix suchowensis TaxID=1278906 RepID=A0ABQ9A9L8_9ROSI|nr:hypothetical protein OIU77_010814 [Salix suchowensis]
MPRFLLTPGTKGEITHVSRVESPNNRKSQLHPYETTPPSMDVACYHHLPVPSYDHLEEQDQAMITCLIQEKEKEWRSCRIKTAQDT